MKIIKWLLSSKTGIAITIGAILVFAASYLQFRYFQKPVKEKKEAMEAGSKTLENTADALELASKKGEKWPKRTDWFPKDLPCGSEVNLKIVKPWDQLGFKDEQKTHFQFRLDTDEESYTLRARSDTDCDGIFAIYTIKGVTDWTATFGRTSSVQNKLE